MVTENGNTQEDTIKGGATPKRITSYRLILQSVVVGFLATAGSYLVAYLLGWATEEITFLEGVAVFTSFICTWLTVKRSVWNFPMGLITTSLYCILFFNLNLYSSMVLQLVLAPLLIYGWLSWGKENTAQVKVTKLNIKGFALIVTVSLVTTYLTVTFGGNFPFLDSAIFFLTLIAQYLLVARKAENWLVWIVVNVIAIYTYFQAGAYLATLQYVLFLVNAFYGFYLWKKGRED